MKSTKFTDSQPAGSGAPAAMPSASQLPPGASMMGRFGSGDGGATSYYPAMGPGGMMGGMPMMGPGMPGMPMGGAFNPLMMMMMLSYSGLQQQFQGAMNPAGGSSASGAFTPVGRLLGRDAGPRPFYPDSTLVARGGHGLAGAGSLALTAAAETACYRCTICKRTLSVDYFRAKKKKSEPMRSKVLGTIACSRCVWIRSADIYCTNCNQFHRVRTTMANAPVSCGVGNQRKRRPHICHTRFCFEHFVYHMPAATFVERSNAVCKDYDEFVAAYGPMDNVFVPSPIPSEAERSMSRKHGRDDSDSDDGGDASLSAMAPPPKRPRIEEISDAEMAATAMRGGLDALVAGAMSLSSAAELPHAAPAASSAGAAAAAAATSAAGGQYSSHYGGGRHGYAPERSVSASSSRASPKPATFDSTMDSANPESQPTPRIIETHSSAASAVVSAALAALAASENLHVE